MDLCDAVITNEDQVISVDDLVEIDGVLTTPYATVTRKIAFIKIPTAATALQDAKHLLNHKLNRKKADSDDEEEIPPKTVVTNDDDDDSLTETSEDSDDDEEEMKSDISDE